MKTSATNDGDVSPSSLRRSTRACALKAAERIKLKEALPMMDGVASHSVSLLELFHMNERLNGPRKDTD